jgi:hypothetical protein
MDALAKSPWTPLVRRPAAVTVVIAVVVSLASSIVVVSLAVVAMVVDALGSLTGPDGVPRITVRPELALDR